MAEIMYPGYRSYVASRVDVNDAMMALLAGSKLAAHTLQLTEGSTSTLAQLFPAVPHISRFNLRSDAARDYLNHADYHIASVSIPYALATHEDFVTSSLDLLRKHQISLKTHGRNIRAWNMHTILFESVGIAEPESWLESFHVLRQVRNCITHTGGVADDDLMVAIAAMGTDAREGWKDINSGLEPEGLNDAGRLVLTAELIFLAFAVTKRLGREINSALRKTLSTQDWAKIAVEDFAAQTSKARNSSGWRRSLIGYVRQFYADLNLQSDDLETAARDLHLWSPMRWVD